MVQGQNEHFKKEQNKKGVYVYHETIFQFLHIKLLIRDIKQVIFRNLIKGKMNRNNPKLLDTLP